MRVSRVKADPSKHRDFVSTYFGSKEVSFTDDDFVFIVEDKGVELVFVSIEQVEAARNYFKQKIQPSSRDNHPPGEHYWQSWHNRLPKNFIRKTSRPKLLKALEEILSRYG